MPEAEKKWEPYIRQINKNDELHSIAKSIGGSLPSTGLMLMLAPTGMTAPAVAGFIAQYAQTYSDKSDEYTAARKAKGLPVDPVERDQFAHFSSLSIVPMEEIGDVLGAKMFSRFLRALPKDIKPSQIGKYIEENPNWWKVGAKKVKKE
jgi:hypothetical protein